MVNESYFRLGDIHEICIYHIYGENRKCIPNSEFILHIAKTSIRLGAEICLT